ncbi:E3 ubiquitin-protein ligase rnf14 [Rhizophlyctis rosea]|uniref:RBR-type E3 ubiquitin transferase n=1 Tax=Rhizophlyctis rosea TaxID=64517 RepID=A0AAD5S6Z8_9FUNG|nr:E3 ubiquitin-protein ligase rnf14 [Rhizophlyctis rosea]
MGAEISIPRRRRAQEELYIQPAAKQLLHEQRAMVIPDEEILERKEVFVVPISVVRKGDGSPGDEEKGHKIHEQQTTWDVGAEEDDALKDLRISSNPPQLPPLHLRNSVDSFFTPFPSILPKTPIQTPTLIATPSESFSCPICLLDLPTSDIFTISQCSHSMCRDCARDVITKGIKDTMWPITCCVCRAEMGLTLPRRGVREEEGDGGRRVKQKIWRKLKTLKKVLRRRGRRGVPGDELQVVVEKDATKEEPQVSCITYSEALMVLLPDEQQLLTSLTLLTSPKTSTTYIRCPNPSCSTILFTAVTPPTPPESNLAKCPTCAHDWCQTCQSPDTHAPFTCAEYQQISKEGDLEFEKVVKEGGWRRCPECEAVCEKVDGCNKMLCKICQAPFCYVCGIRIKKRNPYGHFSKKKSACYNKLFDEVPEGAPQPGGERAGEDQ